MVRTRALSLLGSSSIPGQGTNIQQATRSRGGEKERRKSELQKVPGMKTKRIGSIT